MPTTYPLAKQTFPDAPQMTGKSFLALGGVQPPVDMGDTIEHLEDVVGYPDDTLDDGTHWGRLNHIDTLLGSTEDCTAMPNLDGYSLTHPGGNQSHVLSISSGKLRIAGGASNTDENLRRVYGHSRLVSSDGEVKFKVAAMNASWVGTQKYQWGAAHGIKADRVILDRGLATGGSSSTLVDTTKAWPDDEFNGPSIENMEALIEITGGTGQGQIRRLTDHDDDTINVAPNWTTNPDATSRYRIYGYAVRCLAVMPVIVFGAHWGFQLVNWDNGAYAGNTGNPADLSGYLKPGGSEAALPWWFKSRKYGRQLDIAVWKGSDPEPAYGTVGQSASWNLDDHPANQAPGAHGLYLGHLAAGDYVEFDDLAVNAQ